LEVRVVNEVDFELIKELALLEEDVFGRGGLNEWTLPVFVRYGKVFLLEEKGKVEGSAEFIKSWSNPKLVFLAGFSIRQNKRGKGLGSFFLEKVIGFLREDGVKSINATVSPFNKRALGLYEKMGFVRVGYLENEYGLGEDRLLVKLQI